MMDPATFEAFNKLTNDASRDVGDRVLAIAEGPASPLLDATEVLVAAMTGAMTGTLRVLKASAQAGVIADAEETFDLLMRQTIDTWGQMRGDHPAHSRKLQ